MVKKVCLFFYSRRGNTEKIANYIADAIRNANRNDIELKIINVEKDYNLEDVKNADGYIFGTPDYFSYPAGLIKRVFDDIYEIRSEINGRPAFGFVSHGGGGKAATPLSDLIKRNKLNQVGSIIIISGSDINPKIQEQIKKNCDQLLSILK